MLGFDRIIRPLFSNVFIAINIDNNNCQIRVLRTKKERIFEEVEREFNIIDNLLPMAAIRFIESYKKRYPFCYIGVIAKTYNQSVFHIKKIKELGKLGVDIREYKALKFKDWGVYIKKNEVDDIQRFFKKLHGVDYIFSPFVLIYKSISSRLDSVLRLYVLQEKSNIALFVANAKSVYFGGYFMVESDMGKENEEASLPVIAPKEETTDLLDEFEDLNFDFIQDVDVDVDAHLDTKDEITQGASEAVDELTKAAVIASIIQNSITEFYNNDYYEEKFVEEIVFLDNVGMMEETLSYIEQVTLLPVSRWQFTLIEELLEIIQQEFRGR